MQARAVAEAANRHRTNERNLERASAREFFFIFPADKYIIVAKDYRDICVPIQMRTILSTRLGVALPCEKPHD